MRPKVIAGVIFTFSSLVSGQAPRITQPVDRASWYRLGISAMENTSGAEALNAFRAAVAQDPRDVASMQYLARIYLEQENWYEASAWLEKALEADGRLEWAHVQLGDLFRANAAWAKAVEHYREALRLSVEDGIVKRVLSLCKTALVEENAGAVRVPTLLALADEPFLVLPSVRDVVSRNTRSNRLAFHINFARNRYDLASLSGNSESQLEEVGAALRAGALSGDLVIEGHTCICGTDALNEELGRKRAESIKAFLASKAPGTERANVESYGARKPVASLGPKSLTAEEACERDEFHSANRRVVIRTASEQNSPVSAKPALQVTLEARLPENPEFRPVTNGSVLRSGQQLRFVMQASESIHAYVFHHGSTGKWTTLFPNPAISSTVLNPLQPGRVYNLPGDAVELLLDDMPGAEETLVYAAKEPSSELDLLSARLLKAEKVRIVMPPEMTGEPKYTKPKAVGKPSARPGAGGPEEGEIVFVMRDIKVLPIGNSDVVYMPTRSVARIQFRQ